MNMQAFQYSIVRYVANVVRDEPVNIGVIVRDQTLRDAMAKFLAAAAVSRKAGPKAVALALALEQNLRASDFEPIGSAAILRAPEFFGDVRSEFHGNLRLSAPRGVMAEDIEQATERVFASHVADSSPAARVEVSTKPLSPSYMRGRLWSAFNKMNLFAPGRAAKAYRLCGRHAMWTFDVGYKNGGVSLVNALAIGTEDAQRNLDRALLFKGMIAEVQDESRGPIHAVAVVPPPLKNPGKNAYAEAQGILTDAKIAVFGLQDLDALVRQAQRQLDLHLAIDR